MRDVTRQVPDIIRRGPGASRDAKRGSTAMKTSLRAAVVLAAALVACDDKQGPPGPAGPTGATGATGATGQTGATGAQGGGLYTAKTDLYCRQTTPPGAIAAQGSTVTASCDTATDLPLTGGCNLGGDASSLPALMLTESRPDNGGTSEGNGIWISTSSPARWRCTWGFLSLPSAVNLPNATATICCIKHP